METVESETKGINIYAELSKAKRLIKDDPRDNILKITLSLVSVTNELCKSTHTRSLSEHIIKSYKGKVMSKEYSLILESVLELLHGGIRTNLNTLLPYFDINENYANRTSSLDMSKISRLIPLPNNDQLSELIRKEGLNNTVTILGYLYSL